MASLNPTSGSESAPTADTVIQDILAARTRDCPLSPAGVRHMLEEHRRVHGDAWIIANRKMLLNHLLEIDGF